jgi:glycosyltransferase involved in cell wall biosynthesis
MSDVGERVSVCLLTFNHVALVGSTLDSVLGQTLQGFELIVSDDSSSDGTWELISRRAALDPRIVAVRTPRNLGMAGNANFAASQCRRPLLALLHHDDVYRPDLLEKWSSVMVRHPDVGFVFNAYADVAGTLLGKPFLEERIEGRHFLERHLLPAWGCPVRGTAMIRRSQFDALGGLREQFGLLADVDLWMRLAARAPVGYVPEPLVTVRQVRPAYYPEEYQSGGWSWRRQRYLYEIHAQNRLEHFGVATLRGRCENLAFRTRLSLETAKWLGYALVRGKPAMIASAADSETIHDQTWLRWLRRGLRRWAAGQRPSGEDSAV